MKRYQKQYIPFRIIYMKYEKAGTDTLKTERNEKMKSVFLDYYSLKHPVKNVKLFFRHIKWSWQRIHRGYSDYDVGDIDIWFNLIIPDMLLDFKNNAEGYPMRLQYEFYEKHKEEIGMSYEDFLASISEFSPTHNEWSELMEEQCRKRGGDIIDEMRFLFLESNENTCTKYPYYEMNSYEYSRKYDEICNYRRECRRKAFDLFCEWFECLWK